LVGLCEYDSQFVKDLTLLVKVWRHLEDRNQGRNGVIIGLKLLVKDTDAIPKLRVFDVVK
jgi:hypothetical protein